MNFESLKKKALELRRETFKAFIKKGEAHLGGSFSIIEILITLFDIVMNKNDKFILSKSHASFPYCLLLKTKGYNPKLTTHLEIDIKNGINCTTGSLGQYVYDPTEYNPPTYPAPGVDPTTAGSTQFEIDASNQTTVILEILKYSGIIIRDPQIIQAAQQELVQDEANEKR